MSKKIAKTPVAQTPVKIPDYIFLSSGPLDGKCMVMFFIGFYEEVTMPEIYPIEAFEPLARELSQFGYEIYSSESDDKKPMSYILIRDGIDAHKAIECAISSANDFAKSLIESIKDDNSEH